MNKVKSITISILYLTILIIILMVSYRGTHIEYICINKSFPNILCNNNQITITSDDNAPDIRLITLSPYDDILTMDTHEEKVLYSIYKQKSYSALTSFLKTPISKLKIYTTNTIYQGLSAKYSIKALTDYGFKKTIIITKEYNANQNKTVCKQVKFLKHGIGVNQTDIIFSNNGIYYQTQQIPRELSNWLLRSQIDETHVVGLTEKPDFFIGIYNTKTKALTIVPNTNYQPIEIQSTDTFVLAFLKTPANCTNNIISSDITVTVYNDFKKLNIRSIYKW